MKILIFFSEDKIFIEEAINQFNHKNYLASISILIPRFENIIRNIMKVNNADIYTLKSDLTNQEKSIDSILKMHREEKLQVLPLYLVNFIDFILCKQTFINNIGIRHNVCHGEFKYNEFDLETCALLLYLITLLSNYNGNGSLHTWKIVSNYYI